VDLPERPKETSEYLEQLNEQLVRVSEASRAHQEKVFAARARRYYRKNPRVFSIGDFVLMAYPHRPPSKLSPKWRGPFRIMDRNQNVYSIIDLISGRVQSVDAERLTRWTDRAQDPAVQSKTRLEAAAHDHDEYLVSHIVDHTGNSKRTYQFRVRWAGYGPEEDTWLPYKVVKNLEELDRYKQLYPEIKCELLFSKTLHYGGSVSKYCVVQYNVVFHRIVSRRWTFARLECKLI